MAHLRQRFDEAFRYAHDVHRAQTKKGTAIPMSAAAAYCFADATVRIVPADALSGVDPDWQPDLFQQAAMADARDSCVAKHP